MLFPRFHITARRPYRQLSIVNANFYSILQHQMVNSADGIFLELPDRASITYGQANRLSAQLANRLTKVGLERGDRVTAQIEKSPEAVILYLACLRAGIIFHPLNTAYTTSELEHFLQDAKPLLVVCDPAKYEETVQLANRCQVKHVHTLDENGDGSLWSDVSSCSDQFEVAHQNPGDTALLIYTSGTTGKPKGAMITHHNLSSNAASLVKIWSWSSSDVLLHVLPLFHVHGLCVGLHCPMLLASRILFQPRFSVTETISLIARASVMMAVPTIYTRLLSHPQLTRELCSSFRLFISGSAPLLPRTFEKFEQRTGHRILERYGMSEAQMIASNPLLGERIAGTVGYALPDVKLRVCNEDGNPLNNGQIGKLEIKGPNLFKGYWQNPDSTRAAVRDDGYFVTGDLATVSDDNRLAIVGRQSDLIISAGFNVYPKEVEILLNQIPGIVDSAVFGVSHSDLGEAVIAAIILQGSGVTEEEVLTVLKKKLSAFKIPKKFMYLEELPRNAMGKVEKNRLRKEYESTFKDE